MGSNNKKKPIIEGYLKKMKANSSFKFLGKTTKNWFALDITKAIFSYNKGKKVIHLRDIEDISTNDYAQYEPKEWEHYFKLTTKERTFEFYAQTKAEKEMWVHAFNTILKYKRSSKNGHVEGPNEEEKDAVYDENQPSSEDDPDLYDQQDNHDEGDFMEDNRQNNLRPKARHDSDEEDRHEQNEQPTRNQQIRQQDPRHMNSRSEGESDGPDSDQDKIPTGNREEKIVKKKKDAPPGRSDPAQKRSKNEEDKQYQEMHQDFDELPRAQPLIKKRRDDPEIIDDELPDSDDDHKQINEKENKAIGDTSSKNNSKKSKKKKDNQELEVDVDIDIDGIIKKGIVETINLEPPSPPNAKQVSKPEEPTYFTGFNGITQAKRNQLQQAQTLKQKPVIKTKNIVKKEEDHGEDLLSHWDKKFGKPKFESEIWDGNDKLLAHKSQSEPIKPQVQNPQKAVVTEK